MTPHLDAALDVKGGILEVRVKDAVLLVQTVGIVEPSHGVASSDTSGPRCAACATRRPRQPSPAASSRVEVRWP